MKDELDPVYCGRETEEQNIEEESRRSPSPSRGCAPPLPPVGVFFFFWSLMNIIIFVLVLSRLAKNEI